MVVCLFVLNNTKMMCIFHNRISKLFGLILFLFYFFDFLMEQEVYQLCLNIF